MSGPVNTFTAAPNEVVMIPFAFDSTGFQSGYKFASSIFVKELDDSLVLSTDVRATIRSATEDPRDAEHLMAAFMHIDDRPNYTSPLSQAEDADQDGMADDWEVLHGLNPNDPEDAWRDFDYDRIINRIEYGNGTRPTCGWIFKGD